MTIRQANTYDARRISYLIQKNTENVTKNNYSRKQVDVWKAANTAAAIKNQLNHRIIFCAFENERLIGTIGLQGKEVVGLYVSYNQVGKGIGNKLLIHLEEYAKKKQIATMELTSTPAARSFYERNGYIPKESVCVNVNGVDFHETRMIKRLKWQANGLKK